MMHKWITPAVAALLLAACLPEGFAYPIEGAMSRETPLRFGLYVTPEPENNPIDPPERFTGFHAGLDFEIEEDEADTAIPIFAICPGEVVYSGFAEGYGGLIVQHCEIRGEVYSVLYGHLSLEGLLAVKTAAEAGQQIGFLAPARSADSDGNREHLHLGIRRGETTDYRGYVQEISELEDFVDPADILGL